MTTKALRVSIGFLALLLGVLVSTAAEAAPKRIGVPKFDGVQEALVRKKVMQILKAHGYDLAKSREMEIGLANTGALLDNDEGFQKVAKELALSAIVTGEIGKKRAKIAVHDGKDGSLLGEASFAGANPRKIMAEVGRDFWKKLGGAIERGKTPSGAKKPQKVVAEAPEDDENTPDEPAAKAARAAARRPSRRRRRPVAAAEGGGGEEARRRRPRRRRRRRSPRWRAKATSSRRRRRRSIPPTFDMQVGPRRHQPQPLLPPGRQPARPAVRTRCPPGPRRSPTWSGTRSAPFTDGPAKNIGVEGNIEQAFFVSSSLPTGRPAVPGANSARRSTSSRRRAATACRSAPGTTSTAR